MSHYVDLSTLEQREPVDGFRGRFVHGDGMTLVEWTIREGAALPGHTHPHEQISALVEGRFELTVGGETRVLEPGVVAVIPGGVEHGGVALTDCRILDTFHPVREDYR